MLTLAQEFELKKIKLDITKLTLEESNKYLMEALRLLFIKDNMMRILIKDLLL